MTFGKFFGLFVAFLCLDNLQEGNWRLMIGVTSGVPAFVALASLFFVYESPRFCVFNDRDIDCFKNLRKIRKINRKFPLFRFRYCKNLILENGKV